jgi:mannitol-1-/sugar-/sorbitol-6-/2-deoxyglucose-6-phosphatase
MSKIDKLPLLNDYDAIIFDMDGVLIDSEPLWKIAMEFVFGQYGSTLTHQDFQKTVGLRIDEVIAFWNIQENWKLSDLKNVENQIIDKLISLIEFDPKPLPGVLDTLQFLKESGKKIGLATSSSQRLITTVLRALNIESYFNFTYSAEYESYGKPHPGVYIKVAAHLAVPNEGMLYPRKNTLSKSKTCCCALPMHRPSPITC